MNMSIVYVKQDNFEEEVMKSELPVLLDFYADWCGPCRMIAPILEEIAREHAEYKICKVNVDEDPALAARFEVMSIKTNITAIRTLSSILPTTFRSWVPAPPAPPTSILT